MGRENSTTTTGDYWKTTDIYGLAFTAEEIDHLDSKADAEARREGRAPAAPEPGASGAAGRARKPRAERHSAPATA